MTGKDGELAGGAILWVRCTVCGDSRTHPEKAHRRVDLLTGESHCFRCGDSQIITREQLDPILRGEVLRAIGAPRAAAGSRGVSKEELLVSLPKLLIPGPASPRKSLLTRAHLSLEGFGLVEVFEMRKLSREVVGYGLRAVREKVFSTIGRRGLGFSDSLNPGESIRLVEGPYDVVTHQDVCTFGFPSRFQLSMLAPAQLIFCPDGDVWEDQEKKEAYLRQVRKYRGPIVGFEVLPPGKDPDEVPIKERLFKKKGEIFYEERKESHYCF